MDLIASGLTVEVSRCTIIQLMALQQRSIKYGWVMSHIRSVNAYDEDNYAPWQCRLTLSSAEDGPSLREQLDAIAEAQGLSWTE